MFDFRPICLVVGLLLCALGVTMLAPATVDIMAGSDDWQVFAISSALTIFVGGGLAVANWGSAAGATGALNVQQGFMLTVASWIALVAFAAFPFMFGELRLSYTDAFFESMSGLSTTGSTILTNLDSTPPGQLLWRALLQWIGGIGVIIMAIAILPMLQVGGMQLFRLESSDNSDKILPRASQISGLITLIYVGFSVMCFFAYWAAGMSVFDATAHAMTTIATGGFSTRDASFGAFSETGADMVCVLFMVIGSLPFGLYLLAARGNYGPFWKDAQVRFFLSAAVFLVLVMTFVQLRLDVSEGGEAVRLAAFNVISIMTGTGYATTDYGQWGAFAIGFFFCVMFIGGCAGSTSCGLKIFRFQVALAALRLHARRLAHPHGVFQARYNGRTISSDVFDSVLTFLFVYFFCFAALAIALSVLGLDHVTALSGAGSAIANVGPGLGDIIGPAGTYAPLPDLAKWVLCLGMLLGRLELFTVLVLFAPSFWRG